LEFTYEKVVELSDLLDVSKILVSMNEFVKLFAGELTKEEEN
jgi:hypothetical protein